MSIERPCTPMGNAELRRIIEQGGVHINGSRVIPTDEIDREMVTSVVFFPKSQSRRTTLL